MSWIPKIQADRAMANAHLTVRRLPSIGSKPVTWDSRFEGRYRGQGPQDKLRHVCTDGVERFVMNLKIIPRKISQSLCSYINTFSYRGGRVLYPNG